MSQRPIDGLLENYVLGCIGFLPVETESYMSRRIREVHGGDADWRATLRRVLKLDDGLDTMWANDWHAPPSPDPPHQTNLDYTFWINWAAR